MFKSLIKYFVKKKKDRVSRIREKIWYFGRLNFFLQRKSKNARMGKGKGMLERKVIRVRRGFILFEFKGIPLNKIIKLIYTVNKKTHVKFILYKKKNITYNF